MKAYSGLWCPPDLLPKYSFRAKVVLRVSSSTSSLHSLWWRHLEMGYKMIMNWWSYLLSRCTIAVLWVWGIQLHVTGDIFFFLSLKFPEKISQIWFILVSSKQAIFLAGWLHCSWCCLVFKRLNYPLSCKQLSLFLGWPTRKFSARAAV